MKSVSNWIPIKTRTTISTHFFPDRSYFIEPKYSLYERVRVAWCREFMQCLKRDRVTVSSAIKRVGNIFNSPMRNMPNQIGISLAVITPVTRS